MRRRSAFLLAGLLLAGTRTGHSRAVPALRPNPNLTRAGTMRDGILTVSLEARESAWHMDGPGRPSTTVAAFAETGKTPLMPGPLIRAVQGTKIRISVRNSLTVPLTFFVPAAIHGGPDLPNAMDSVVIAPAATGTLTIARATAPGNYIYRGVTPDRASTTASLGGALAGAIVVDTAGAAATTRDRVFVIMASPDSALVSYADTAKGFPLRDAPVGRLVFTINGRSWPTTERISATVGDSLHWRIINASALPHPMHLHGFYYRVDALTGPNVAQLGRPAPGEMVVTQLMPAFASMSMSWSPDRPGNWIFHCHLAIHLQPDSISAEPGDTHLMGMVGLVLGIQVAQRPGGKLASDPPPARHLRLIAVSDAPAGGARAANTIPTTRFVLEENGHRVESTTDLSPELDLTRGEPVSITIVNRLAQPTSVHWHGIELEDSYMDGVSGFSGAAGRVSPEVAPGDSFEVRFTPPRSGTFMYHTHMNEMRTELGGLEGALIVRDSGAAPSPDDHVFFLKGISLRLNALGGATGHPFGVNGTMNPDTIVLHVGRPARFRFLNLSTVNVEPVVWLTTRSDSSLAGVDDTSIVQWRPLAKDGFDFPASAQRVQPASQYISIGETYDFEYVPSHAGNLRLELRQHGAPRNLLARVPIRVE
jgi:FtsP/CotA-like multicopper oxidase with cupredoxin domain